jgi:TatD DNase family protein
MKIIDTHAHLDELEGLDLAINRAKESGLEAIIAVGSSISSNLKTMAICQQHADFVYPAFGLHPWEMGELNTSQMDETIKLIEENVPTIVAIGEIGLDYDKRVTKKTSKGVQIEILTHLLALAVKYDKPVSIHSRYSWKDCFDTVSRSGVKRAVFHWFTGPDTVLREILDAGYFISCTPAAEYHDEHRRAIKETPLEQLLLETDCPVMYGRENRYRSQPSDIIRSLGAVALLKDINQSAIGQQTTNNAKIIFNIK